MIKISEREWTFRGTDYHLRAYVDLTGRELPLFLVEEARDNRGRPLAEVRGDLAQYLAGCLEARPEQVTWIEQRPDGALVQYDIQPYAERLSVDESERATPSGGAMTRGRPNYNFIARELGPRDRERLEGRLKDRLHVPRGRPGLGREPAPPRPGPAAEQRGTGPQAEPGGPAPGS